TGPADAGGGHAADASAGTGLDARLGKLVAGLCIAEATAVLSRYVSTAERQDALAKLGALDPLASLVAGGGSDLLVLRCALEALVRFTAPGGAASPPAPLAELAPRAALLPRCLALATCGEEVYEALAGQLLAQLLEAPLARAQLRRLGAVPALLAPIQDAAAAALPCEARRATCALRCCRQLARDHVELADPMAVQEPSRSRRAGRGARPAARGRSRRPRRRTGRRAGRRPGGPGADVHGQTTSARWPSASTTPPASWLRLVCCWRSPGGPPSAADAPPGGEPSGRSRPARRVQLAAARLLRFVFGVERNRRAFKRAFSAGVLTSFIDVGSYVWPLQAYAPFVGAVSALTEQEAEQVMSGLRRRPRWSARGRTGRARRGGAGQRSSDNDAAPPGGGRVVNGYELLECVGAGAFGRVHLARRHDGAPGEFALKDRSP
ncbi:unnamed protein product, partial [Prorocentrum cordatum]